MSSRAGKGCAHPGPRTSLAARRKEARCLGRGRLPDPGRADHSLARLAVAASGCGASRKWARGPDSSHPGVCARDPVGSRVSSGTGARRSHGEALCHSHSGRGPVPAAAAPPFALHGARPSLSGSAFCAWAACLSPFAFLHVSSFAFLHVSSPDSNTRVAGPAVSQKPHV